MLSPLKETVGILITKIKDKFHRNEGFYQFEKEKVFLQEAADFSVIKESDQTEKQDVLQGITKHCERYLYDY